MLAVGNFLFLTPAKTGSTSLEKYLSEHFKIKLVCTKHDIHVPAAYRDENPECKTVLLVRNPYDWFISHYYWSNTKGFDVKDFPHVNQSSNRPKQALKDFYTKDLLYIIGPFLAKEAKALGYPIMEV